MLISFLRVILKHNMFDTVMSFWASLINFYFMSIYAGFTGPKSFDSSFGCADNGMHTC